MEIVEMGLHGSFADLLVIGEMDEERSRGILRRQGTGHETVHDLFLGGRDFGTGDESQRSEYCHGKGNDACARIHSIAINR